MARPTGDAEGDRDADHRRHHQAEGHDEDGPRKPGGDHLGHRGTVDRGPAGVAGQRRTGPPEPRLQPVPGDQKSGDVDPRVPRGELLVRPEEPRRGVCR
ncbi:hypothetical protein ACFFX0_15820 [Citricoccus parietis]|uniref:Uncharacterized protein n=1 Tax=Citricoccus parietis TaxID=592307 RepID=A0ABV5G0Y1_9MICC